MISTWNNNTFYAEKAEKDKNGESLELSIDTTVAGETEIKRVTAIGGKTIYAEKADADSNGDSIVSTYAKKSDIVKHPGYIADGGTLTDNTELVISNNTSYYLNTEQTSLTFIVDIEQDSVANFEVTIKSTASADCTVNVMVGKNGLYSSIMNSAAGSTTIETGKTYQLTCSRDGWTLAEFEEQADTGLITRIGGRTYKVVRIGNLYWMAENLDFNFSGLVLGHSGTSETEPRGNYYDNNSSSYGILYNWPAVKYLEDNKASLIPGWHVATSAEWDALVTAVGGTATAGTKLKSTTDWLSGAGTDDYGFSALPAGYYNGSFDELGSRTVFWTSTVVNKSIHYKILNTAADITPSFGQSKEIQYSIRLVKDA